MSVKRIEHIDVWRFFAVALVILEHFLLFSGAGEHWSKIVTYSLQIERFGELGVLIFFSISGFVICSALNSEKNATGKICLSAFYTRRFFRIIPPLWLYLACAFLLSKINAPQVITSAAFLCNFSFFQNNCPWLTGHTWSLAYEEQFYLFYPLLFLWAWRGGKSSRILIAMIGLILSALTLIYFKQIFWADYCIYFLFLLTGCFTALLPSYWMQKLRNLPFWFWLVAVVLLVSLLCFSPSDVDGLLKMLCYPALIQVIVFGTPTHFSPIKTIFEQRSLSYLGRISYSVYLWQQLATAYYENMPWWLNLVYLVLVFIFAAVSFHYFEMPCQRLGTRFSNQLKIAKLNRLEPK
ncbi:MAG: acyltransferase [Methylococcaceae bacterium]